MFLSTSQWYELAGPQLRRGGRKCRTERRKNHPSVKLVEGVQPSANAQNQTATEASTGHTSPFKPNGEATLQETSLLPRRKCVNSSKATRVLTHNTDRLLYQALHPRRKSHLPKNPIFATKSNTQTPGTKTARSMDKGNNVPDSKCELREHKGQETRRNSYKSIRRLTHDEGPVPAFTQAAKTSGSEPKSFHQPLGKRIHTPAASVKKPLLLSQRRGWARLGEQFPTPSADPSAHFFPRGKVRKKPLICRTRQTGRRRCRMKNSATTRNWNVNDLLGSRCRKMLSSTKRCRTLSWVETEKTSTDAITTMRNWKVNVLLHRRGGKLSREKTLKTSTSTLPSAYWNVNGLLDRLPDNLLGNREIKEM